MKNMSLSQKVQLWIGRTFTPLVIGWNWRGKKAQSLLVREETISTRSGRIRVRIYTPESSGPHPALIFFHGGGWVLGNLDSHDAVCRDLCVLGGRLVVSVEYRMAPEHPFPVPVEDCLDSLAWLLGNLTRLNGNESDITICGDSAGGNLAAVVCQQAKHHFPGTIKAQVLVYPVMDYTADASWPSYRTYGGKKFGLTHDSMLTLWDVYTRNSPNWKVGMTRHDLATPLHTPDLSGLPRTLIVLAEEDLLCDEGKDYARRLMEAGIPVDVHCHAGQRHGFIGLAPTSEYRHAMRNITAWLIEIGAGASVKSSTP